MRSLAPLLFVFALVAPAGADDPPKIDLKRGVEYRGLAEAHVVQIRSRVTGYIERVLVKEGEAVKKGDVLVELDDRPYRLKLDAAKAQFGVARAVLKRATADLDRATEAFKKGALGRDDMARAEGDRAEAEARIDVAKAAVAMAELDLAYTKLVAPIDGKVGRFTTTTGNLLVADRAAVVSVIAADPIVVAFDVDERTFLALRRVLGDSNKPTVEVGLADEEGYPRKAVLESAAPVIDPAKATARFRATLANPKDLIVSGQSLRVRLSVQPGK
jgi:RND family efflux transporter MFP subunit